MAGADFAEASLAQDAVHPESLGGDGLPFQPLPLEVAVEVHRLFELVKGLVRQVVFHLSHALSEQVTLLALLERQ